MRRFFRWLRDNIEKKLTWVIDESTPLLQDIPGLPYVFKKKLLDEYVTLGAKLEMPTNDTYMVTAMVEMTITRWMTWRRLRDILAPQLTFD